jgi:NhaA family Na+:H+ antiporter
MKRFIKFAFENSVFLIAGALIGLVWANIGPAGYAAFRDVQIIPASWVGLLAGPSQHGVGLHYLVNDVLMALFFALAGKEVWSAMLPGGALRGVRRAAVPVICAVGGMAGPAAIYVLGAACIGQLAAIGRGWAIPCATDIAFSYMIALLVFGKGHPAVPFLLLLAIADDALGLMILAAFYPQKAIQPLWLLLTLGAVVLGLVLRRRRVRSFWWYLLVPGSISWTGLALAGLHPALGLLPIIPTLPHARMGEDHVHWGISRGHWALDRLESWWKNPVEVILGVFGLVNAGVPLTAFGGTTYLVLIGLLLGKPAGILLGGLLARTVFRLSLPHGLSWRILLVIGCAAGIGFTVALFVATVAFPPGPLQDASKMGALASALAAVVAVAAAKLLGVRKVPG